MEKLNKNNKLLNGDCLVGLKKKDAESIDLTVTSPPYNLGSKHHTGNKIFAAYDEFEDNIPEDEYQENQIAVLNEIHRVTKETGSLMYNHKNRIKNGLQITPYEWLLKTNWIIKQELVWFNGSQNFDKIRFYPMTGRIYWLVKNKDTVLNNVLSHHDLFTKDEFQPVGTNFEHKRSFPLSLAKSMISCFPESKNILDPYSGSGTTAIASVQLKKTFTGFEISKKSFYDSIKRIEQETAQMSFL